MFLQVVGRDRLTVLAQVRGRRIQTVGDLGQTTGCELSIVGQIPEAQRDIESLGQQVHAPRGEVEFQGNGRMQGQERGQHVLQKQHGDFAWHRDTQTTRRLHLPMRAQGRDGINLIGNQTRMFKQLQAELGEGRTPRGTHHQSLPEQLLQLRDATRDGRFGQTEAFGRAAETARFGDSGKNQQIIGIQLFHGWNDVIRFDDFRRQRDNNKVRPSLRRKQPSAST